MNFRYNVFVQRTRSPTIYIDSGSQCIRRFTYRGAKDANASASSYNAYTGSAYVQSLNAARAGFRSHVAFYDVTGANYFNDGRTLIVSSVRSYYLCGLDFRSEYCGFSGQFS